MVKNLSGSRKRSAASRPGTSVVGTDGSMSDSVAALSLGELLDAVDEHVLQEIAREAPNSMEPSEQEDSIPLHEAVKDRCRLLQVTGNEETCFNDVAVFWCSTEMDFLIWEIRTRTGRAFSFIIRPINTTVRLNLTLNFSLVAEVTFISDYFINVTVTILMGASSDVTVMHLHRIQLKI